MAKNTYNNPLNPPYNKGERGRENIHLPTPLLLQERGRGELLIIKEI